MSRSDIENVAGPGKAATASLSSANTQRRDGWCQEILMVETTQYGVRPHGNILAQAMSGSGIEVVMSCRRRIRTRSQIAFAVGLCGGDFSTWTPSFAIDSSRCFAKILSRS